MERISGRNARLSDVAERAGVSKATASNVFNRPQLVREEVRARVLAAAKAIGYAGPDPKGRMLSAGKVNAIGVATAEPLAYFFEDPFARAMMVGITEVCDANGIGISLVSAATEDELAWSIRSAVVDGLILFCLEDADRLVAAARERRLPFVALAFGDTDDDVSVVGVDDVAGARLAARAPGRARPPPLRGPRHGVRRGRRRPGRRMERVEAADYATSRRAGGGLLRGARRPFGIDTGGVPIFETTADPATIDAALEALFAAPEPPTALLAQSDRIAMRALDWLKARGLAVPGDVSVDRLRRRARGRRHRPAAHHRQPADPSRSAAARSRSSSSTAREVRRETLDVELVVRASTGRRADGTVPGRRSRIPLATPRRHRPDRASAAEKPRSEKGSRTFTPSTRVKVAVPARSRLSAARSSGVERQGRLAAAERRRCARARRAAGSAPTASASPSGRKSGSGRGQGQRLRR